MTSPKPSKAALRAARKIAEHAYGKNVFAVIPFEAKQHQKAIAQLIEDEFKPVVEALHKIKMDKPDETDGCHTCFENYDIADKALSKLEQ